MNTTPGLAFVLALAVGSLSLAITRSGIGRPLRRLVNRLGTYPGELFSCPFCMSFWLALLAALAYRPVLVPKVNPVADALVTALAIQLGATFFAALTAFLVRLLGPAPRDGEGGD